MSTPTAKLLYENGADWVYATGTTISDPALFYQSPSGKTHIVVNELEWEHLARTATVDKAHSFSQARAAMGAGVPFRLENILAWLIGLDGKSAAPIQVSPTFPAGLFVKLTKAGFPLEVTAEPLLFPSRAIKTESEIKKLHAAQKANDAAFELAHGILKAAKIQKDGKLTWQNAPLTAEVLQGEMNALLVKLGCTEFSGGPIVATGPQSAIPHERGHGPLRANQFILIDCFPRHKGGYFADCTRTFLKGKADDWHKNLYNTVLVAQELALKLIKPGANGHEIHTAVEEFFTKAGHKTGTDEKGRAYGFFHGTGHGVGLELHDPGPAMISTRDNILQVGHVTSVEPGLYYPGKGGVRIEDTVAVTAKGHKNFAAFPKSTWLIR
ncbi:MAG: M24 family metallopeptidase [Proteobacteria bacterium]|nr:M24 family metallopeptidase [Pseudomonadota bacterium]